MNKFSLILIAFMLLTCSDNLSAQSQILSKLYNKIEQQISSFIHGGNCSYQNYEEARKEVIAQYQPIANAKCENIYVCETCCLDNRTVYVTFRIKPTRKCWDTARE